MCTVKSRGFSLIEMIVVMAILGVLAAIAYPAYTHSILKSNRADAKSDIMDYAQRLQRCYTANGTYVTAAGVCAVMDTLSAGSGATSRGGFYNISVSNVSATGYLLTATAIAGGRQAADTECATFTLDSKGQREAYNQSNALNTECW